MIVTCKELHSIDISLNLFQLISEDGSYVQEREGWGGWRWRTKLVKYLFSYFLSRKLGRNGKIHLQVFLFFTIICHNRIFLHSITQIFHNCKFCHRFIFLSILPLCVSVFLFYRISYGIRESSFEVVK